MQLHPKEPVVQESAFGIISRLQMTHVLRPEPAAIAPPAPAPVLPRAQRMPLLSQRLLEDGVLLRAVLRRLRQAGGDRATGASLLICDACFDTATAKPS
jgi:hypothetical protein